MLNHETDEGFGPWDAVGAVVKLAQRALDGADASKEQALADANRDYDSRYWQVEHERARLEEELNKTTTHLTHLRLRLLEYIEGKSPKVKKDIKELIEADMETSLDGH